MFNLPVYPTGYGGYFQLSMSHRADLIIDLDGHHYLTDDTFHTNTREGLPSKEGVSSQKEDK